MALRLIGSEQLRGAEDINAAKVLLANQTIWALAHGRPAANAAAATLAAAKDLAGYSEAGSGSAGAGTTPGGCLMRGLSLVDLMMRAESWHSSKLSMPDAACAMALGLAP